MVVYILYSKIVTRFYTGHADDFGFRLHQHNSGKTKSIKFGIPWDVVFTQECGSRAEAMKLEKKIKSRGAKRFLAENNINIGK